MPQLPIEPTRGAAREGRLGRLGRRSVLKFIVVALIVGAVSYWMFQHPLWTVFLITLPAIVVVVRWQRRRRLRSAMALKKSNRSP